MVLMKENMKFQLLFSFFNKIFESSRILLIILLITKILHLYITLNYEYGIIVKT